MARDVARALVPVACAGCGARDVRLCEECAAPWWEDPQRCEADAPRLAREERVALPVWTVVPLEGVAHRAISEWKDRARRDLDPFFCAAIGRAAQALPRVAGDVAVVPCPSRPRSVRRRGTDLPLLLASAVRRSLAAGAIAASLEPVLSIRAGDSRRASSARRWETTSIALKRRPAAPTALLVDDVVTTGATLARASDALEAAGIAVVAALTLAAAQPPGVRRPAGLGWESGRREVGHLLGRGGGASGA